MENITDKGSVVSLNNLMVNVRKKQLIAILRPSVFYNNNNNNNIIIIIIIISL